MYRLGVLSDTHGRLSETRLAVRIFRERGVTKIIHCGDIGGIAVIQAFRGIETHFVFGNTDCEHDLLRLAASEEGHFVHGWFGSLEWENKKIGFLHGHHQHQFDLELNSGHWDLMCYGHTHTPLLQMHGETLLLNPGAFSRITVPQVAIVTIPELNVESVMIENKD
ncbi:MAG: YfcE family phosphodiesterase [Planctomycetaceae bacterium]|jgi:putative phosphoesterase|nr:YfcE family phosphodiesterase [Planctomycetaceae bacterium]